MIPTPFTLIRSHKSTTSLKERLTQLESQMTSTTDPNELSRFSKKHASVMKLLAVKEWRKNNPKKTTCLMIGSPILLIAEVSLRLVVVLLSG